MGKPRKIRMTEEIWFEALPADISKALRASIARLHQDMGHPPPPDFLRNLAFSNAGKD